MPRYTCCALPCAVLRHVPRAVLRCAPQALDVRVDRLLQRPGQGAADRRGALRHLQRLDHAGAAHRALRH